MLSPNLAVTTSSFGKAKAWQHDAWEFYDRVGELRFATQFVANAMSRVNLAVAAQPRMPGEEPVPLNPSDEALTPTQRRAIEIVSTIADGAAGQGQILAAFGVHLTIAGVGWLLAEPPIDDPLADTLTRWQVLSTDEIRQQPDGSIEVRLTDREWRQVHPNAVVVRVWKKHPRWAWESDSPTRGVLGILREIELLSAHIQASAQSRLAGAGVLAVPSEAVFPPGQGPQAAAEVPDYSQNITAPEDTFVETLIDAMTTPLTDRGSAAAVVPLVVKIPGELVDKVKHITFATPFDDRVLDLLNNAIRRLALGMDIPPEILTGTGAMNHWGAWAVEEQAVTLHVEPLTEMVCHALTIAFLRPALEAEGYNPDDALVWYDTADLRVSPDRTTAAVAAYDRGELSKAAFLRELGFAQEDAPSREETRERLLLDVGKGAPTLAPAMLAELGYIQPAAIGEALTEAQPDKEAPASPASSTSTPPPVESPAEGPPDTRPTERAVVEAALIAACDQIVRRALERAGARLRSAAGKRTPGGAAAVPCADPTRLHTTLDATEHADLGSLLDGAWSFVPEVASRYGYDPEALEATLDSYTRALLAAGQEHRHGRLAVALGAL